MEVLRPHVAGPVEAGRVSPLLRSFVLALLVALGAGIAPAAAATSARVASDPALTLAERYAPVVRVVRQDERCEHGEPYVPTSVDLVLGSPEVALRGPWEPQKIVKVAPTGRDLSEGLFEYHLDFPGSAVRPGCTYDEWSHEINRDRSPVMYAHVVSEPGHPEKLALQYWFFYLFNDFNDKHEGDWEMIQLNFDAVDAAAALRTSPTRVGYSQHEGAESAAWGAAKLEVVGGTHPVVYSALGSHANYFSSELYLGRSAAQGVGCDDTRGPSDDLRPEVSLLPTERASYLAAAPWLGYVGHWGEKHPGFYNGPTGPNTKPQWTRPITWADTEWRDDAFAIPAGGISGTTATGFFCGAVATGSSALTALVRSPSPFFIVLVLLVALTVWLGSRTEWHPSAPLHLERRRDWGAILNAGRRMYLHRPRVFLGIGLLFIPVGLLITGVQLLLFRVGSLSSLVDSAGRTNAFVSLLALTLGLVVTIFTLTIVHAATAVAMREIDAGRSPTALGAYRRIVPKILPLLGVVLIAALVVGVLALTSVGIALGVWLVVRWSLLAQVVVLEDRTAFAALRRSAALTRRNWWRVATLLLFVTLMALVLGPFIGTLLLFISSASFNVINLIASLVYVVVLPFAAIATTYMYFDLRVEKELDVETAETDELLPRQIPAT